MKRCKLLFVWLVVATYCWWNGHLFAQKDSTHYIEEISVVASRKYIPILKTLDYIHISCEDLLKHHGNTLAGSLERIPGLSAIHTGVGISKPVIRGLSLNRIVVNEYGIKQEGQQWGLDHGLEIDQYNVHQLEVIKGPVSLLYGSDGIGGVINILPAPILPTNTFEGEGLINYKSNNDLYATSVALRNNKNDFFTDFRFTYQDFADYRVPAQHFLYNSYILPIDNQRLKNTAGRDINLSGLAGIKRSWGRSSIYISNVHQDAGFFVGAFGTPYAYLLTHDGNYRSIDLPKQQINHLKIISNTQLLNKRGFVEIDFGYQHNDRKELSRPHAHGLVVAPQGNLALQLQLETFTANVKTPLFSSDKWKVLFGFNFQTQKNKRSGYEFLIPDYNTWQGGINTYAEYNASTRWMFSAGIRLDGAIQKASATSIFIYDSIGNVSTTQQRSPHIDESYVNTSGSLGLRFTTSTYSDIKLDIGTAYRIPTVVELTSNGVHHGTFRHELGDSALHSERGYMLNTNYHYQHRNTIFSVSPFVNYFDNYIYLRPSSKFSPLPDAGQIYQYTQGKALFFGGELSFQQGITEWLNSNFGIEYVFNENINLSMPLPFTPPFSIREEIEFTPLTNKHYLRDLHLILTGHYYASQTRTDINEPPTDSYFLIHLTLGNAIELKDHRIECSIQIRNVANVHYLNNMSRYRILNLPEQGRSINATVRYKF